MRVKQAARLLWPGSAKRCSAGHCKVLTVEFAVYCAEHSTVLCRVSTVEFAVYCVLKYLEYTAVSEAQ